MIGVDALMWVELAVFLASVQLLVLGAVLVLALDVVLAWLVGVQLLLRFLAR